MVLYIDFEWETEPLKMALSKTLHCLKNVKTTRAPTVQCWSDSFLTQNYLEVVLYLSGTGVGRFWPRPPPLPCRRQKRDPAPIPAVNVQVYFKRRRKESEKKEETYRMKMTLPLFLQKNVFFHKNLSLLIISVFFVVFRMNAACVFFTLILFFCLFTHPSLIASLPPPQQQQKILLERSQWGHMH